MDVLTISKTFGKCTATNAERLFIRAHNRLVMGLGMLHVHSLHGLSQIKSIASSQRSVAFTLPAAAIGKKDLAVPYHFTLIAADNNCSSGIYANTQ